MIYSKNYSSCRIPIFRNPKGNEIGGQMCSPFGSSDREVRKNEGLRNQDSTGYIFLQSWWRMLKARILMELEEWECSYQKAATIIYNICKLFAQITIDK